MSTELRFAEVDTHEANLWLEMGSPESFSRVKPGDLHVALGYFLRGLTSYREAEDIVKQLRAEIESLKQQVEQGKRDAAPAWLPIETAPKNIERVLIFSEKRGVREARFYRENSDGTVWYDTMVGGGPMTIFYDVTHWIPLPAAPNDMKQEK